MNRTTSIATLIIVFSSPIAIASKGVSAETPSIVEIQKRIQKTYETTGRAPNTRSPKEQQVLRYSHTKERRDETKMIVGMMGGGAGMMGGMMSGGKEGNMRKSDSGMREGQSADMTNMPVDKRIENMERRMDTMQRMMEKMIRHQSEQMRKDDN